MKKAYAVYDPNAGEPNGEIIFSDTENDASKAYCVAWYGGVYDGIDKGLSMRRAENMDQYQDNPNAIPASEFLKIGWAVECNDCGFYDHDHQVLGDKALCEECYDFATLPQKEKS